MHPNERPVTAADFARWVKGRRTELMLSQDQLADRAGLSVRTVRNLEAGRFGAPRPETRRLVVAVLGVAGDNTGRTPAEPPRAAVVPAQLPPDIAGFVGRAEELRRCDALLAGDGAGPWHPVPILAVAGTAGVGKTALAVGWAHRVRRRFPDGQLFVDLRGFAAGTAPVRPIDALSQFLRALGVPADEVPMDVATATDLYRSMLADRRMLVLLDNAAGPDQVRPLLPGGAGNLILVTSRDQLGGLIVREGATRVTIGMLHPGEAHDLLARILGGGRVSAEPAATAELARLCAFLPLALRIAATNLHGQPHRTIAGYVAALRPDQPGGLAVRGDGQSSVRALRKREMRLVYRRS